MKAAPDGYTLMRANTGVMVINPALNRRPKPSPRPSASATLPMTCSSSQWATISQSRSPSLIARNDVTLLEGMLCRPAGPARRPPGAQQ